MYVCMYVRARKMESKEKTQEPTIEACLANQKTNDAYMIYSIMHDGVGMMELKVAAFQIEKEIYTGPSPRHVYNLAQQATIHDEKC